MFTEITVLRSNLRALINSKQSSGVDVGNSLSELESLPNDYQELFEFSRRMENLPLRSNWKYVEPSDLTLIKEASCYKEIKKYPVPDKREIHERASSGFISSVVGCVLGKPLEIHLNAETIIGGLKASQQFPLTGYISKRISKVPGFEMLHPDAPTSLLENIDSVPPDDDINYTILGLLLLEQFGVDFTHEQLAELWRNNLVLGFTWGPERTFLAKYGLAMGLEDKPKIDVSKFADTLNPGAELCGAMIRSHIFGYVSPGDPIKAAELAWRDASMTHRGNGIYGSMFLAACISLAFVERDKLQIFKEALKVIPKNSRLFEAVDFAIKSVERANFWEDSNSEISRKYPDQGHCKIFQEIGTLINSVVFAKNTDEGIVLQLYQGNDTDSFGSAAGAVLGTFYSMEGLSATWLEPFQDRLKTSLACFHEGTLSETASRVGTLAAQLS